MKKLSYTFTPGGIKEKLGSYDQADLELMTTFHLRDICRKEKIIHAATDTMDKEELIRIIMRFRGAEERLLVKKPVQGGHERIASFMKTTRLVSLPHKLTVPSKVVAWQGLDTNWTDGFEIPYQKDLVGTNALIISNNREICAMYHVDEIGSRLFLCRSGLLPCLTAGNRNYAVYLFGREYSDVIYHLYYGNMTIATPLLELFSIPILDFQVKEPVKSNLPLVIDFGTSNTAAGTFLDAAFYEQIKDGILPTQLKENKINYVDFLKNPRVSDDAPPLIPTVIGVKKIDSTTEEIEYVFGREAQRLANLSYIDEGFCVFHDIKRWIGDCEIKEELTDLNGRRLFVKRKEIMKAFLNYIIKEASQRFKCRFEIVYMSCPVKQKKRFISFYKDVLSDYTVETADILDEGVSVLYNTIRGLIDKDSYVENEEYRALIVDCGGGTTDLSACRFSVQNLRVSYDIQIETSYENGDTNFGGNNITFRMMQFLKLILVNALHPGLCMDRKAVIDALEQDLFRFVDKFGTEAAYYLLEEEYEKAEEVIPTRFKEYERRDRRTYYQVKNNYYFLFETAERLKKAFFGHSDLLEINLTSTHKKAEKDVFLLIDKWKLSVREKQGLTTLKAFPEIKISVYEMKQIIKANIYGIIRQFMEKPYETDELSDYNIIKLTGQSCKIDLFRDCLKEFVPGRMIQFTEPEKTKSEDYGLKLSCLDGSIRYMMDKKFGLAKVRLTQALPSLPYLLTGFTHAGEEIILIHSLDKERTDGSISRTLESTSIQLTLKDLDKNTRYQYNITAHPRESIPSTYEEIARKYSETIPQDDVDAIQNGEVRYFVWSDPGYWGFAILPIFRKDEELHVGEEQFVPFENDHWVSNYFDGTR